MAKTLYMETTAVPADRTAGEICAELVKAGTTQINTSYDAGRVTGLKWVMRINGIDALFSMPACVDPIEKILRPAATKRGARIKTNKRSARKPSASPGGNCCAGFRPRTP